MPTPTGRTATDAPQIQQLPVDLPQSLREEVDRVRWAFAQRGTGKSWLIQRWRWMLEAHEARAAIQREAARQGTAAISRAVHEFLNSFRR